MRYYHIRFKDGLGKWYEGYFSERKKDKILNGLYNGRTAKVTDCIGALSEEDIEELRIKTKKRGARPLPIYN